MIQILSLIFSNISLVLINNISYVNFILVVFIIISLVFTFNKKGTTIHKVLGLLLLSIFVVFLWILQTQFLFIYIVYILAFISAVLMLFLSVVLMLPISSSNIKKKYNFLYLSLFTNNDFIIYIKFFILVFILFIIFINLYNISKNNFYYNKFNGVKFIYFINYFMLFLKYSFNNSINFLINYKRHLSDVFIQSFLFISIVLLILTPLSLKQDILNDVDLSIELTLGLGYIKTLLYGDFNLFLIFSTFVLLIALFGAAIMTRSIKK